VQIPVSLDTPAGRIEGFYDSKFAEVYTAFVDNFLERDEVGASCSLTLEGKPLLDLWGGRKTRNGEPWTRNTISMVFSSTKGAMALCAHLLADRGELDLDAPITRYWPEFGAAGKTSARVSMTLDHTVGVPHVRAPIKAGGFWDYPYMVERIAAEPAFWEPGTRQGYHGITMAWTVGELVHRASKRRLGRFFDQEIAKPLGLDFWIGLPTALEDRVAPMILAEPDEAWVQTKFIQTALTTTDTPTALFMRDFAQFEPNTRACRAAEVGSANGIANARALAGMYAPLANRGSATGARLLGTETITRMGRVAAATAEDATLMIPTRFALGYMKSTDNRRIPDTVNSSLLLSEPAFGHVGAGGSIGFADPECNLSFGYSMNRMGTGVLLNARGQALIDAAYRGLGYRTNQGGAWTT
jgi:CubicO group peptidase (beta-lactamase class C family)